MKTAGERSGLRYQVDESPRAPLALGLAAQYVALNVAGIVLTVAVVVRAGGGTEAYLAWAAFAALLVSGVATAIQAAGAGRLGAGYILLMGTSGAFIAISVAALQRGGPPLLATMILVSSLFQFALAARLSWIRRVVTPTVAGTVIMLIAVTVMPIAFDLMFQAPAGASPAAAPATAAVTLAVTMGMVLRARGAMRLWGAVVGVAVGCVVSAAFGLYDASVVEEALWIGAPTTGWPGLEFRLDATFWSLLPAFVFVTLVGAIETIGDGMAIQRVSWRRRRATDFRAVQGAVAADGVGNLLSGLMATVPNTTYSNSVSMVEITGVAARRVGVWIGAIFVALAFLPKATAFLLAIPNPVVGAYVLVLIAILFVLGLEMVVQDGIDYRKAAVVGVSFWIGAGFQSGRIASDALGSWAGPLLENGMTSGGLCAILLSAFMELSGPRRRRMRTAFAGDAFGEVRAFLEDFAARARLDDAFVDRLTLAAEEALLILRRRFEEGRRGGGEDDPRPKLRVAARMAPGAAAAEIEFAVAAGDGNVEDRLAELAPRAADGQGESEFSLRLLRHLATSVRHQKYHDADVVTIRVDRPKAA